MNEEKAIGQVYASEINQIIVRSDDLLKALEYYYGRRTYSGISG